MDAFDKIGIQMKLVGLVEELKNVYVAVAWNLPIPQEDALWKSINFAFELFIKRGNPEYPWCYIVHIGKARHCDYFSLQLLKGGEFRSTLFDNIDKKVPISGFHTFKIEDMLYVFLKNLTDDSNEIEDSVFKITLRREFGASKKIGLDYYERVLFDVSYNTQHKLLELLAFLKVMNDRSNELYQF